VRSRMEARMVRFSRSTRTAMKATQHSKPEKSTQNRKIKLEAISEMHAGDTERDPNRADCGARLGSEVAGPAKQIKFVYEIASKKSATGRKSLRLV
jgi:hypothetical protein